jgi:hypothetical protein
VPVALSIIIIIIIIIITVLTDIENKTAPVTNIAVLLTRNLPKTDADKITKYEHLAQAIRHIWNPNDVSVYSLVISAEGLVTKNFLKCLEI